jgi:hypothetical protein
MKKHLAIAVGVLVTLGTAVSATLSDEPQSTRHVVTVESHTDSMATKQSAQILALWKTHSTSAGSVPLARPL